MDEDFAELVPEFLASRRELLVELRLALQRGEREAARRLAHRLAGGFAMYGFHWAGDTSRALESETSDGNIAGLLPAVEALEQHLSHVVIHYHAPPEE